MSTVPFFQVDAFAEAPLTGNPAAVMPLERWLDDALMQAIATENNLSETAFTVQVMLRYFPCLLGFIAIVAPSKSGA